MSPLDPPAWWLAAGALAGLFDAWLVLVVLGGLLG
jgi:hypothetical protein